MRLLEYFLTISGSHGVVRWTGLLKDEITGGGYGLDTEYWARDLFRTRVIVTKPRVWVLNVVAIGGKKEAVEILDKIFKSFQIRNDKIV